MDKVSKNEQELLSALQNSQETPVLAVENPGSSSLLNNLPEVDEADEGLIFYDPQAEAQASKEAELLEKQRNKMNLQKESGATMASMAAVQLVMKTQNQRGNLLAQLKKQNMQKRSQNLTLEKVKSTFQATDWNESKPKASSKTEIEDEEDDSDFDEEKALEEQKRNTENIWDDEENVIDEEEAP